MGRQSEVMAGGAKGAERVREGGGASREQRRGAQECWRNGRELWYVGEKERNLGRSQRRKHRRRLPDFLFFSSVFRQRQHFGRCGLVSALLTCPHRLVPGTGSHVPFLLLVLAPVHHLLREPLPSFDKGSNSNIVALKAPLRGCPSTQSQKSGATQQRAQGEVPLDAFGRACT